MENSFYNLNAIERDPDALWKIVHNECVPDWQNNGNPRPCAQVNVQSGVDKGTAVLKDLHGDSHFLVIPTLAVSGIESSSLLEKDAPSYFEDAWQARSNVLKMRPGKSREDIGLAINSEYSRSQQQLHIHVEVLRPEVRDAIKNHLGEIGDKWSPLSVPLAGHHYLAMKVNGEDLQENPFKLLADGVPGARENMELQTLVVVGEKFSDGKDGFVLLNDHVDPTSNDWAHGEELLEKTKPFSR